MNSIQMWSCWGPHQIYLSFPFFMTSLILILAFVLLPYLIPNSSHISHMKPDLGLERRAGMCQGSRLVGFGGSSTSLQRSNYLKMKRPQTAEDLKRIWEHQKKCHPKLQRWFDWADGQTRGRRSIEAWACTKCPTLGMPMVSPWHSVLDDGNRGKVACRGLASSSRLKTPLPTL